jgi:hypothetical protein
VERGGHSLFKYTVSLVAFGLTVWRKPRETSVKTIDYITILSSECYSYADLPGYKMKNNYYYILSVTAFILLCIVCGLLLCVTRDLKPNVLSLLFNKLDVYL